MSTKNSAVDMEKVEGVWQGNKEKHASKNPLIRILMKIYYRNLISIITKLKPKKILDAGCGEGFISNKIKKNFPDSNVEGMDLENYYLNFAKSNFKDIIFFKGSIYEIPKESNTYDLVLCNEVLEHLENPDKAIKELIRISNKYLLVSVPNEPYFRLANIIRLKYLKSFGNPSEHLSNWTKNEIKSILNKYGKVELIKTSTLWNFVLLNKI